MIPKKAESLIPKVAKDLEISEQLLQDIVDFTWKKLKKNLTECNFHNIHVENLGTFCAKSWKVEEAVAKYKNIVDSCQAIIDRGDKISYQTFAQMKMAEVTLERVLRLKSQIDEDAQKKQAVKLKRNGQSTQENLAQQGENP